MRVASTLSKNRSKLYHTSVPCVFLSYSFGKKGYKLLNLQSMKCFVSRNVVFMRIFPLYLNNNKKNTPIFLVTQITPNTGVFTPNMSTHLASQSPYKPNSYKGFISSDSRDQIVRDSSLVLSPSISSSHSASPSCLVIPFSRWSVPCIRF